MLLRALVAVMVCGLAMTFSQAQDAPASQPAKVPAVDFRKLKEVLPENLAGVKRSEARGEKQKLGEFTFTTAHGEYQKEDAGETDPNLSLELFDYGAAPEMASMFTVWQQMEIDRESDNEYEKTVKIKEHPGLEKYNSEGKHGELQLYVANRFLLTLNANNISQEQFKKAIEELPVEKLAALK